MGSFNDYLKSLTAEVACTKAKAQECVINAVLEQMRLQNLTEEKIAEKMHMSKYNVSLVLSGNMTLFDWGLLFIAHALNCDLRTELVPKERAGEKEAEA